MNTFIKMRNYWIGMILMPFILVTGAAIHKGNLDELFTDKYMFSEMNAVFIATAILVIIGTYAFQILRDGIKKDIQEIRDYVKERRIANN